MKNKRGDAGQMRSQGTDSHGQRPDHVL